MKRQPLPLFSRSRWCVNLASLLLALAGSSALAPRAQATGFWIPDRWLDDGGKLLKGPPQFFWDIEVSRLASVYAEREGDFKLRATAASEDGTVDRAALTASADLADFEDALKTGRLQAADSAGAIRAHQEMRAWLKARASGDKTLPKPDITELPSEFADYHQAAALLADGDPAGAVAKWTKLLDRPAAERHYRSVWAAFMLGKCLMLDEKKRTTAITWFEKCRGFAKEGFADSTGLAADSYGWQARAEYDAGNPRAAARHYLQQLVLGDRSAVTSLKLLVPDRSLESWLSPLSFATFPPQQEAGGGEGSGQVAVPSQTEEEQKILRAKADRELAEAARDVVLRQLVTAHILATSTWGWSEEDQPRLTRWLETVEKADLKQFDGAASLGWVAYTSGKFEEAERWAKLEKPASPLSRWLLAKLALRKGAFEEASQLMGGIVNELPGGVGFRYDNGSLPKSSAAADLGASLLAQGKFTESLTAFLEGACWRDAAYVAERALTTKELVQYVNEKATLSPQERSQPPGEEEIETPATAAWRMKNNLMALLGRRLIREGNPAAGRVWLPEEARKSFDEFQSLNASGGDAKLPKMERAKALFKAARLMKSSGDSWRGTAEDVDRDDWGQYSQGGGDPLINSRLRGQMPPDENSGEGDAKEAGAPSAKAMPIFIPSTLPERKRIAQSHPERELTRPYTRFAAELALKAAALLPDNAEETADVLNRAGRWIQDIDNPAADKIYFQIEKRCPQTAIGQAIIKKHWFIEPNGPWTSESAEKEPESEREPGSEPAPSETTPSPPPAEPKAKEQ